MIGLKEKENFLKYFLSKFILKSYLYDFLHYVYKSDCLLNQIVFSRESLSYLNYRITIDLNKKQDIIYMRGRYFKELKMLKYILRGLIENPNMKLNICIISSQPRFQKRYDSVCHNIEMVEELIKETQINSIITMSQKLYLKELIDRSLDNNNKEEFLRLTNLYNSL